MTLVRLIWSELFGLFVDDEFLAVVILIVVALAAAVSYLAHLPLLTGTILLVGCVGVLVASALRARR